MASVAHCLVAQTLSFMMRVILLGHSLDACLLATQPVTSLSDLGAFCILGIFFLSIGAASKEERRSYGGLGDWGGRIRWAELRSFLL